MWTAAVEISDSLQKGLDDLIGFLPRLIGFLIILLIGYIIAKVLQKVVAAALEKVGTDRAVRSGASGEYIDRVAPDTSPSRLIGRVVFWFIMLGVLSIAISSLGIAALNDFLADVFAYLPNVIVAILILVVAIALSSALSRIVTGAMGETGTGKMVATAVPALVLAIAVFMALNQLKIATEIVTITYAALLGSLALGSAFGLGGREVASRMLEDTYRRGQLERERYRAQKARTPRSDSVAAGTPPPAAGPAEASVPRDPALRSRLKVGSRRRLMIDGEGARRSPAREVSELRHRPASIPPSLFVQSSGRGGRRAQVLLSRGLDSGRVAAQTCAVVKESRHKRRFASRECICAAAARDYLDGVRASW